MFDPIFGAIAFGVVVLIVVTIAVLRKKRHTYRGGGSANAPPRKDAE